MLIQQPVYYPFRQVIESNDRKLISSDLVLKEGHYEIDFEDFEAKIKEHQIHLFLLCSPHNPHQVKGSKVYLPLSLSYKLPVFYVHA